MNRSILALLALGLLAAPVANATMVTWEIRGTIDAIADDVDGAFEEFVVGDAYSFRWTFDTAAPLIGESPARTYRYNGSSTTLGVDIGPVTWMACRSATRVSNRRTTACTRSSRTSCAGP